MENKTETYWLNHNSTTVLARESGKTVQDTAWELAYIAGDYGSMSDMDVIETFRNENGLTENWCDSQLDIGSQDR